jgi:hypothetical protein
MTRRTDGFTALELVLVAVVVIALGLAAIMTYNHTQAPVASPTPTPLAAVDAVNLPGVEDLGGFDAVIQALDQVDLDANDTDGAELDTQAASF